MPDRIVLLDRHQSALERAENREARRAAAAYRKARQEIVDRLITQWPGTAALDPAAASNLLRQSGLLQQIDTRLAELERELGVIVRDVVSNSTELGLEQIQRELALLPPALRPDNLSFGTINTRMVERFVPVAFSDMQLGTRSLSLQLQRELQTGLIQGESFTVLVGRLMRATPEGQGAAVWRNGELSAERAVRRLVITAENGSKQDALAEINRAPGLKVRKQVFAAVGKNTTDCCLRAHAQIRDVDKPFDLVGTPRFADRMMHCPFHWGCRSSIAMYHPAFEESSPTAKLVAAAKDELRSRENGQQAARAA